MIYVSTGGMKNYPAWKSSEILLDHGIKNIELSGGLSDSSNLENLLKLSKMLIFKFIIIFHLQKHLLYLI